ncbi:MAG: dihydropteroate synthase [Burkholderiales bacterium]|nr:dihydropteroate synthase [Burkholderiales bacterium]
MAAPDVSRLTPRAVLRVGRFDLALERPLVMGVVNVTPDSFSDGGRFHDPRKAIEHARRLVEEGADILDVGGESTRPGSLPVDVQEELRRILPVLDAMAGGPVPVSVDTSKPEVMRAAVDAGAAMINDIYALRQPGALEAAAATDAAVCLMHMQGDPRTMQDDPVYGDVVAEVKAFLDERVAACEAAGIGRDRIVVDPGFGFGKKPVHNLDLIRGIPMLAAAGLPVLAGLSRKSVLGKITGRMVGDRIHSSVAAAIVAVARGARIVRVHDVAATRDALAVWTAVENSGMNGHGR